MDSLRWDRMQTLFHEVVDLPPSERQPFLATACGGDETLIAEVLAMLEEDTTDESLLDRDLPQLAHALLGNSTDSLSGMTLGSYRIRHVLGEGGMGVVYLAEHGDIGSVVAVKLLRDATLSPARRARFEQEKRSLALLEHPFIAHINDGGILADGTPWFVMEYVDGIRITDYCRQRNSSIHERLELFHSVCEAVQYAHSKTVVHCDLKPSNILVKADGTVKLLDFGIARQLEADAQPSDMTRAGMRPMTPAYAAPEQILCREITTKSDVYSLGVILYELLTGRLPFDFDGKTPGEIERIVQDETPVPPSAAAEVSRGGSVGAPAWPGGKVARRDLDVLTLTAMHRDADRRYASAEALMRDIGHYQKGEPLEACPDTARYRLGKFVKRNRHALIAAAVVAAVFITVVVLFVVGLARARNDAVAEATRTQRIERFMLNLFDGGDKTAGPADSLRVVTLLNRGEQTARALSGEPGVQEDLYQTLGGIYERLGKFDRAEPLMRSSLERRKAIEGPDSHDVADSLVALGTLRVEQSQLPEAEQLVRQGLAMNRRHLPAQNPAIARDLSALGRVLEERGSYDEAIKTLDEAVRLQSARPALAADLSESLNELATAHYYLGHLPIAESHYKRALEIDRQLYGAVYPRVADDLYGLGIVQHDLGHDAEAERYYRQALSIKQSWYGEDHPDTALIMAAVAQSLVYQGRLDEAAPVLQQALAMQERIFGKMHAQVAMGLNQLGVLELRRGHLSDAEQDFIRMEDINRAVYGDRHFLVGLALLNRGQVYLEEKRYAPAERFYRDALSRFLEALPPGHTNIGIAQTKLGHVLLLEQRYKEAEGPLLAGYDILIKQPGPQAARLADARKDLLAVYEAMNQPDKAAKFKADQSALAAASSKR
ncbi:MAG: serine/threonine-protein kinase [Bryobacteraceae bacterium]